MPDKGARVLFNDGTQLIPGRIGDIREHGKANIDLDNGQVIWAANQGENAGQWQLCEGGKTFPGNALEISRDEKFHSAHALTDERAGLIAEHERLTGRKPHSAIGTKKLREKVETLTASAGDLKNNQV